VLRRTNEIDFIEERTTWGLLLSRTWLRAATKGAAKSNDGRADATSHIMNSNSMTFKSTQDFVSLQSLTHLQIAKPPSAPSFVEPRMKPCDFKKNEHGQV
jgi:hypothetical protein